MIEARLRARLMGKLIMLAALLPAAWFMLLSCHSQASSPTESETEKWKMKAENMVKTQIQARGVSDERVLSAMRKIPRQHFVEFLSKEFAFEDTPLPIGYSQTISQPFIVAYMTELLKLSPEARVLEIGTGSGYQAAVLSKLARQVYSIEIVAPLARRAAKTLKELGYENVQVRAGDGYRGWPEEAPFDAIIVTAAPERVPEPLIEQLKPGGVLVLPLGGDFQVMKRLLKSENGIVTEDLIPVRFVPMTGEVRSKPIQRR